MIVKRKYVFPIIWLSLIVYASLTPPKNIPDFTIIPHFDKIVHFCMYFGLAFLLVPALLKNKNYPVAYLMSLVCSALIGTLFELMQTYLTSNRTGSIYDEIANATGAIFGIVAYQLLIRNKKRENVIFKIE